MRTVDRVRGDFSSELKNEGDFWRVLRRGSLVDLIKLSFFNFQKERNEKYLVNIFNYSMKLKLLSKLKSIEIEGNMNEFSEKFNKETELILRKYDELLDEFQKMFEKYDSASLYDLYNKIQYIKVVNQLEIDSYTDEVFDDIICISYNLLHSETYI